MESGIEYDKFWDMTLLEIECYINRKNKDIKMERQNIFLSAKLISYAFNEPNNIPSYEQIFESKPLKVDENAVIENKTLKDTINECNLKGYFEQKKHFVISKEV